MSVPISVSVLTILWSETHVLAGDVELQHWRPYGIRSEKPHILLHFMRFLLASEVVVKTVDIIPPIYNVRSW